MFGFDVLLYPECCRLYGVRSVDFVSSARSEKDFIRILGLFCERVREEKRGGETQNALATVTVTVTVIGLLKGNKNGAI